MSWHQTGDKPLAEPNGGLDYLLSHYSDVIMVMVASQIISLTIVYPTVYSGEDKKKNQSFASLAFVRKIHRSPVNSPHKGPVMRKMFPFDEILTVEMECVLVYLIPRDKMAAYDIFRCIFVNIKFCIFIPKGPVDNIPTMVEKMTWRRIGDKPLSRPMLTQFTDAYMWHWRWWVYNML